MMSGDIKLGCTILHNLRTFFLIRILPVEFLYTCRKTHNNNNSFNNSDEADNYSVVDHGDESVLFPKVDGQVGG